MSSEIAWDFLYERYEAGGADADADADAAAVLESEDVVSITSLPGAGAGAGARAGVVRHAPQMLAVLGEGGESSERRALAGAIRTALTGVEMDLDGRFDVEEALEKAAMPELDSDFAPLIRRVFGGELCYVSGLGVYRAWDGQVWRNDSRGQCVHAALLMLQREYRGVLGEITARMAEKARDEGVAAGMSGVDLENFVREERRKVAKDLAPFSKAAYLCATDKNLRAVKSLLTTLPGFVRSVDDFDVLPSLSVPGSCVVVFGNAWVDFGEVVARAVSGRGWEMTLRGFTPSLSVTQSCAASWAGEEWEDSLWGAYLHKVWPDLETREMLLRYLGMCMLGLAPSLKFLLVVKGEPDSAKTLLVEVVRSVLGDYAGSMSVSSLMQPSHQRGGAEHTVDLHRHRLSRFVISTEPSARSVWNTSLVKALTGGDSSPTRGLGEAEMMEWPARMGLAVATNEWPRFRAGDEAMETRVLAAETLFRFVKEWDSATPEAVRADPGYKDRLLASERERSAVLASLVEGVRLAVESAGGGGRWVVPSAASRRGRAGMMTELSSLREVVEMAVEDGLLVWVSDEEARVSLSGGAGSGAEWCVRPSEIRELYVSACTALGLYYVKSNADWAAESAFLSSTGKARLVRDPITGSKNAKKVLDRIRWADCESWEALRAGDPDALHGSVGVWLVGLRRRD